MNENTVKKKRTAAIVVTVIVLLLTLIGVFVVPPIVRGAGMIAELFGYAKEYADEKKAVKDAEEGYETGLTEEGYYRFVVRERWNAYGSGYVVNGSEEILRSEHYRRGKKSVTDFIPLKDGSADIVTALEDGSTRTYELLHLTVSGGRVSGYLREKLNAAQFEELTGAKAYGYDYSISLRDMKNALEEAGLADELNSPATEEAVKEWEKANGCKLPEEYRKFLMFSDGFRHGSVVTIYSLGELSTDNRPEGSSEGCFIIGETADSWLIPGQNGFVSKLPKDGSEARSFNFCNNVENLVVNDLEAAANKEKTTDEKDT